MNPQVGGIVPRDRTVRAKILKLGHKLEQIGHKLSLKLQDEIMTPLA